jgi:hypothetical protein
MLRGLTGRSPHLDIKSSVRKALARRLHLPEIPVALERLSDLNFKPETIYDVGAYRGDFAPL